jgi:predicted nucleotidyltransferase
MYEKQHILSYLLRNKSQQLQKYHLVKVGIFGSYARNEQHPNSDLDLIVDFEPNTPNLTQTKEALRQELQQHFHLPVDICTEKYIKPFFKKQILAEAEYV